MFKYIYRNTWQRISIGFSLCILLFAVGAINVDARVSGSMDWDYSSYSAEQDGQKVVDATSFSQKYSVYYDTKGFIKDRRFGQYDLGVGYQWTSFDTKINSDNIDVSTGKILYRGEVLIAPGALPFRLHAFSYDNNDTVLLRSNVGSKILDHRSTVTNLLNGQNVTTGLSLRVGIRNGSYLGRYREFLSRVPRLFLDFKENYVRDQSTSRSVHYRTRDLAFVSLNKKDNWFHYRYKEHVDYEHDNNDFQKTSFTLGTVDQNLHRQWINLTNWIKLSVDGSLISVEKDSDVFLGYRGENTETYQINLFTDMTYDRKRLVNYNSFIREKSENYLDYDLRIPFYAHGQVNPGTSWRSSWLNDSSKSTDLSLDEVVEDEKGSYFIGRVTLGERGVVQYTSSMELEARQELDGEGYAGRLRLEALSNTRVNFSDPFLLGYKATYTNNERENIGQSYLEQQLYGRKTWLLSPKYTLEASQFFLYGSGDKERSVVSYIVPAGSVSLKYGGLSNNDVVDSVFRSTSLLALESRSGTRLKNRYSISQEFLNSVDDISQLAFEHRLDYRQRQFSIETTNLLVFGDQLQAPTVLALTTVGVEKAEVDRFFQHSSSFTYKPNKSYSGDLIADFTWTDGDAGNIYQYSVRQKNQYSFFTQRGYLRRFAEINQEFNYNRVDSDSFSSEYYRFILGANYYPTRIFQLGGELSYEDDAFNNVDVYAVNLMAALTFTKLTCEVSYGYGSSNTEREEHYFKTKIRKTF